MRIKLDIYPYDPNQGVKVEWGDDCIVQTSTGDDFTIAANRAALIELAKHLLTLAQEDTPPGSHIHYDEWFVQKANFPFILTKIA